MSLPEIPDTARQAVIQDVYADDPVSNLEQLGVPARTLGLLEESRFQIVRLEDLIDRSREEIDPVHQIGRRNDTRAHFGMPVPIRRAFTSRG